MGGLPHWHCCSYCMSVCMQRRVSTALLPRAIKSLKHSQYAYYWFADLTVGCNGCQGLHLLLQPAEPGCHGPATRQACMGALC
jgi:hypothetical protein